MAKLAAVDVAGATWNMCTMQKRGKRARKIIKTTGLSDKKKYVVFSPGDVGSRLAGFNSLLRALISPRYSATGCVRGNGENCIFVCSLIRKGLKKLELANAAN